MASRKKIAGYSLIGLLILVLLILVLLPTLIKNYTIKNGKELVGRQIDIEDLSINYFTNTLSVYGFKMFETNDTDVFTSFDTLIVNTVPYKFINNVKALDQFYLEGLNVNIAQNDSIYNFDDIIAFFKAKDTVAADTTDTETFKYLLENLQLKNASFDYYDGNIDEHMAINDFSFYIPVIAWDQEHESDADVNFDFENGGVLKAKSNVHPSSGEFRSTIDLENLNLNSFYKYASQYADINALEGTLNTTINLNGNINTPEQTLVSGDIEVIKFLMKDNQDEEFLSTQKVSCQLKEIDVSKNSYAIESVAIDEPYLKFELDSVSNNIFRIFKMDTETSNDTVPATAIEEEAENSMFYALNTMKLNNGVIDYTDNLTGQPFNYHLSQIMVDTDSIYSNSDWVDILSTMLLNERGTLNADVGFDPVDVMNNLTLDIAIKDFLLSDLNIYSNYYTGHSILVGDMFYFSESKVNEGALNSENNLLIKNVSVETAEGGLFSLPLKFAIFLLKDKNGDIEFDVPVRGDLNNPEIDIGQLVWTTLKKMIFNATDNPVGPLARFMDVKPEDLESIAFQYPDTIPNDRQKEQLDLILDLEQKKEGLEIEMNYAVDREVLSQTIANSTTELDTITSNQEVSVNPDMLQTRALNDSIQDKSNPIDSTLVANSPVHDSLAADYVKAVVASVSNYLISKNSDTKIIVQKAKISNPDNMASDPGFKVKYSLKEEDDKNSDSETN